MSARPPSNTTNCGDGFFGPTVWSDGCRGGFDFTVAFEETILTILPAALFLLLSLPRTVHLWHGRDTTKRQRTYTWKLIVSGSYAALQIPLLVLVAETKRHNTRFSIASATLNLLASFCIVLVTHIEHVKSIRPSFLLTSYLFVSIIFDAARLRTEWLIPAHRNYAAVLSASFAFKLTLLALETIEKRRILVNRTRTPSKESTSGPLNRGLFLWLNSLLISGWATILTNTDLPTIYEKLSSEKLAEVFSRKWDRATRSKQRPSLFFSTINILKWNLLSIALPRLGMVGLSISQPFLVSLALRFLSTAESEATTNLGYGLIGAFAFVFVGSAILTAWHEHLTFRASAMVRGGLITMIYQKMMKMPVDGLAKSSAVTLMGNDVETLAEQLNTLLVQSWANAITVTVAVWMLSEQLGVVCIAPIVTGIIALSLSTTVGKRLMPRQAAYQKATQDRINFTSEVLGSAKAVRMLGYTEKFASLIEQKRDDDLSGGSHFRWLIVLANAINNTNSSLTLAATFGAYAIAAHVRGGPPFSASQAITALSILLVMLRPLGELLGSIPGCFSCIGCFRRVQEFLMLDERIDARNLLAKPKTGPSRALGDARDAATRSIELEDFHQLDANIDRISLSGGCFSWGEANILSDITASFKGSLRGSLTMIVGPVGSGKSTLLKAILGETKSATGTVSLNSSEVAFCDQTPWVMNATIRDNIVAESQDFEDSWFDAVVEACDLAVDISRLPLGDLTTVGNKGLKLSGGQKQRLAIARAVYAKKPVAIFDDVLSGLDKITEQTVFHRVFGTDGLLRRNGTTIVLTTHAVHRLPESGNVIALGANGIIVEQGPFPQLRLGGKYIESLNISETQEPEENANLPFKPEAAAEQSKMTNDAERLHDQQQPASDRSTLRYYFAAIRTSNLIIGTSYIIAYAFLSTFLSVWLTWWGDGRGRASEDVGYWLGLYTTIAASQAFFVSIGIFHFLIVIGPVSGKRLHSRMLKAVMGATTAFLSETDSGSLINRFSQDIRLVDMVLPLTLVVLLFQMSMSFSTAGLAISAIKWVAIAMPFLVGVLVMIQRFYVRTSKQLRILEIEHKAPLYSHFLESIQGLVTIRAFGWTGPYIDKSLALLDNAQKPSYLLNCIQRWLTLVLDLVVAAMTLLLVVCAVVLRGSINPSLLGIALVSMMNMGNNLKGIIIQWSTLETALGAVTRIRDFAENTPSEVLAAESRVMAVEWPARGALEIQDLSVRYDDGEPILQKVSLSIEPGEKVGICGRSGSGKSSLVQALLRMVDITEGQILLDGEDITQVPRSLIRQKLSCLTQDPFLLAETVKFNADPLEKSSDEAIVQSLEQVGLWDIILAKVEDGRNPLYEKMDENFLSHGQRQLFCLARALLKKTSILILDEPTSSVDKLTDSKIQQIIRSEFKHVTVIMIAHRISTMLDFDKVVVLDNGLVAECGSPADLLMNESGPLSSLYRSDW